MNAILKVALLAGLSLGLTGEVFAQKRGAKPAKPSPDKSKPAPKPNRPRPMPAQPGLAKNFMGFSARIWSSRHRDWLSYYPVTRLWYQYVTRRGRWLPAPHSANIPVPVVVVVPVVVPGTPPKVAPAPVTPPPATPPPAKAQPVTPAEAENPDE